MLGAVFVPILKALMHFNLNQLKSVCYIHRFFFHSILPLRRQLASANFFAEPPLSFDGKSFLSYRLVSTMARKVEKTPEELEQEFKEEIGMGDALSRSWIALSSLFDGGKINICLATLFGRTEEVELTLFYHPELIDSLWDWGSRPKMTLLHCAVMASRNREMTLELLLKKGMDAQSKDGDGLTPMEYVLQGPRDRPSRRLMNLLRNYGSF